MAPLILPYPISANRYWRVMNGRAVRSAEADSYKRQAGWIAKAAGVRVTTDPVHVALTLHPKATKSGAASRVRLDLDNCIKVCLDALNGVAYRDDRQVVKISAEIGPPMDDGGLSVMVTGVA